MTAREPRRLPPWLGEATFQAALIVLSLLLALAADEWRDRRARAERVEVALAAIRQELAANRVAAARAAAHHRQIVDTLRKLDAVPPERRLAAFPGNVINPAAVVSTAWQVAQLSGAVADMPLPLVLALARVYDAHDYYARTSQAMLQMIYTRVFAVGYGEVTKSSGNMAGIINDMSNWERGLTAGYSQGIAAIDSMPRRR